MTSILEISPEYLTSPVPPIQIHSKRIMSACKIGQLSQFCCRLFSSITLDHHGNKQIGIICMTIQSMTQVTWKKNQTIRPRWHAQRIHVLSFSIFYVVTP
jgi:hypothetical protein